MTNEQKQHLLAYLGLYKGIIDGDFGPASREATRQFQDARNLEPVDGDFGPITEKEILKVIGSGIKSITVKTISSSLSSASNKTNNTSNLVNTIINSNKNTGVFQGIKHFTRNEFVCQCGGKYCKGDTAEMNKTLLKVADRMRDEFDAPVDVSSGIRCSIHNKNSGGVYNSEHLYGKAMDFRVRGKSADTVLAWVNKQPEIKYAYKINNNGYVHMNV